MAKTAQILSVRTSDADCFRWLWRSADQREQSSESFAYFYECVEDARRAGYSVELAGASGKTVDGKDRDGLA